MSATRFGDAQVLWQLLRGQPRLDDHRECLERFYAPQARHYDAFRERLLAGRAALLDRLCLAPGQHVVELGGGTARNLEYLDPELRGALARVDVVDLCPSLLERARERCRTWSNVHVIEADAATYTPPAAVDRVYFSYALTMMPEWRAALRNAFRMLRPGGLVGVVDFGQARGGDDWRARADAAFWRRWFGHDGVRPDPAHGAYLDGLFERVERCDGRNPIPYLPGLRAPYFIYVGRK
ncbi:MAG: class I SAM-dependent methyltransferase [Gammaproteobacteria bacterium]|nr:class I SAM-dependent methyltransferase [Gammaproteobacteria bacterium]MCP5201284.1 class I SAM-dependent methyltransferase [Gammaproteobacteria bacterium]